MVNVYLKRGDSTDHGTFGIWTAPSLNFSCLSLELPWRDNTHRISCIPIGDYVCVIRKSPKFGIVFHLTNVEGRSFILVHWGNFAGDVNKGWKTHSAGCLLLGQKRGYVGSQKALLNSRVTISLFMRTIGTEPFKLMIQ